MGGSGCWGGGGRWWSGGRGGGGEAEGGVACLCAGMEWLGSRRFVLHRGAGCPALSWHLASMVRSAYHAFMFAEPRPRCLLVGWHPYTAHKSKNKKTATTIRGPATDKGHGMTCALIGARDWLLPCLALATRSDVDAPPCAAWRCAIPILCTDLRGRTGGVGRDCHRGRALPGTPIHRIRIRRTPGVDSVQHSALVTPTFPPPRCHRRPDPPPVAGG